MTSIKEIKTAILIAKMIEDETKDDVDGSGKKNLVELVAKLVFPNWSVKLVLE